MKVMKGGGQPKVLFKTYFCSSHYFLINFKNVKEFVCYDVHYILYCKFVSANKRDFVFVFVFLMFTTLQAKCY